MIKDKEAAQFHQAITYDPYSNQVYAGEHPEAMPTHPKALLATYSKPIVPSLNGDGQIPEVEPVLSASMEDTLRKFKGLNASSVLQAAPDGQGNSQNLTHLQLIRLLPQIQGLPIRYFYLENAFLSRAIPKLEFRESWTSVESLVQLQDRMQEVFKVQNTYSEIKYDLTKLVGKVFTPIEDIYRTIINPMAIDKQMMDWAFQYRRNELAIAAIKQTTWGPKGLKANGSNNGEVPALGKLNDVSDSNFHSNKHVAVAMNDAMLDFLANNDVEIDTVVMNPKVFSRYTENTWTLMGGPTGLQPIRMAKGGVVPLPGFEGVTAVVDVAVPTDSIYFLNRGNALRMGEGPKIMRRYYEEEKDGEAIRKLDFVQFLNVDHELSNYQPQGYDKPDTDHSRIGNRWFSFKATVDIT